MDQLGGKAGLPAGYPTSPALGYMSAAAKVIAPTTETAGLSALGKKADSATAAAQAPSVAPVVTTSSTRRTERPAA